VTNTFPASGDYFISGGVTDYYATHFIGGFSGFKSGTGSVNATFYQTITFSDAYANPESIQPVVIKDLNSTEPFSDKSVSVPVGSDPIGVVQDVSGTASVTRQNGNVEPLTLGTPIYYGDIIETEPGGTANVFFADETSFIIGEDARLEVDEYVYDPSAGEVNSGRTLLRGVFLFTSGLIGNSDPEDLEVIDPGCCGVGIRGSAEDIVREELLNNPNSVLYGNAGIWMETASPVSASTFVELPAEPFTFGFDFTFLTPEGNLTVNVGGLDVFSFSATPEDVGVTQSAAVELDWEPITTEVTFTFDGPAGNTFLLSNLDLLGLTFTDLDGWFHEGNGPAQFVWIATEEQLDQLLTDATNAALDADNDGISDILDICTNVANADQTDTDSDGYGNACDPDFDQNGVVDSTDLSTLKSALRTSAPDQDLNGNGVVDSTDYSIAKSYLRKPPGPSCCGITLP
jgi:hypothetical protein